MASIISTKRHVNLHKGNILIYQTYSIIFAIYLANQVQEEFVIFTFYPKSVAGREFSFNFSYACSFPINVVAEEKFIIFRRTNTLKVSSTIYR